MNIFGIFKRKRSISKANTTKMRSNYITVRNKYMSNNKYGGGHKWTDHFRSVRYR